ncbi:DNA-binding MarR family transcriptional regulator [Pigmentiphaga kullae]|uniref:DNA-binding MarR family transcriptional regulator n=1 Tax=Pigmentiphaga kullae TaxID=151784 RepID=A0A4Q7N8P6_9BURK|nr:DNA-binding MarR family transcriptional regulator [Pigmentiphaga kullae]
MPRRPHETAVTKKLETYFTYKLDLIKSEAVRQVNELYRKELGLVVRDLRVLRQIGDAPGISVSALQAATFIEKTVLSKVVSRLIELGLAERSISTRDARAFELTLTARGRRVREQADRIGGGHEREVMFGDFSEQELRQLDALLDKLMQSLRAARDGGAGEAA